MSQQHLYGQNYDELNPPVDWPGIGIQATINDNAFEAEINTNEFVWVGEAAEFMEAWRTTSGLGVFNGVPYRIQATSDVTGITEIIFDGYINLAEREILSVSDPIMFRAPIVELDNNVTVFNKVSILSQRVLQNQGFITLADSIDVPVIKESKKNVAERALILGQLLFQVVSTFIGVIQNFMSAISDVIGVSIALGLVELFLLFVNTVIQFNLLFQDIAKHKDLFFPLITYYKGLGVKTILEKAFEKLGYTVDFGEIDSVISKIFLLASQDGFDGFPSPGFPGTGVLNNRDWGYRIGELMQTVEDFFNTRQDVRDGVVHIKNRLDPFWTTAPAFQPVDALLETTLQYQNGTKKEDTDRVHSTWYFEYIFDPTDTHTLTQNADDSYEIHRELITELDPKMNTLDGIKDIKIPYALAVRKEPFDNLLDLFTGISDQFDFWLDAFQTQITDFAANIGPSAGAGISISSILAMTPLSLFFENRAGVLKIDDNAFGKPKWLYLEDTNFGKRIPANFKEFVGGKAVYTKYYLPDSPADVNDFKGQYIFRRGWRIPFSLDNFNQTKDNPYFDLNNINGKFTSINWTEDEHAAVTDAEQQEVFDTNITETEV